MAMRTKVFWVDGPWRSRLGILPRPRGGDWLRDETATWREAGVDVVVSLLEPEEAAQLVLEGEAAAAAESGIAFRLFPIPDRGVPAVEFIAPIQFIKLDERHGLDKLPQRCRPFQPDRCRVRQVGGPAVI